jgi:hypothetical protein
MTEVDNIAIKRSLAKDLCQTSFALILLCCGGIIYIALRSETLLMFSWADHLGLGCLVDFLRESLRTMYFGDFIMFSLPDGFWLLSYMLLIDTIWREDHSCRVFFASMLPFIAISFEFLQLTGFVSGTFDVTDLMAYLGAIIIYRLLKLYSL